MEYDDKKAYEDISLGNTLGVFQLESAGMRNFMKQLKPNSFEDIVAGISLFRPGPMDSIPTYIKNKHNPSGVKYLHEKLRPILDVTYGCLVYQEQVMQVVRELAGYSFGRSDLVRRAMSKKKMDVMEEERQYFIYGKLDEEQNIEIPGCIRNGVPEEAANEIFDNMIDFAKYAFNKSHAAAYGVLAYETAFLKAHYPVEFMAALMTSVMGNTDKVVEYIKECKELKIDVLPPDINKSYSKFSVDGKSIRFGLAAVKNVGANVIDSIVKEREEHGEFTDFADMVKRLDSKLTNKRVVESLIKCGAFDNMGENRATLMAGFEETLTSINRDRKNNLAGQLSIFDLMGNNGENPIEEVTKMKHYEEYPDKKRLELEKEVLGLYVSGHPLAEYEEKLKNKTSIDNIKIKELKEDPAKLQELNDTSHIIGGIVEGKRLLTTKKNDMMAFVSVVDLFGTMDVVVFPNILEKYQDLLKDDSIILVKGRISIRGDDDVSLIAEDIKSIDDETPFSNRKNFYKKKPATGTGKTVFLRVDSMKNEEVINEIYSIIRRHQGTDRVVLFPLDENQVKGEKKKTYALSGMGTYADERLKASLDEILGCDNVILR